MKKRRTLVFMSGLLIFVLPYACLWINGYIPDTPIPEHVVLVQRDPPTFNGHLIDGGYFTDGHTKWYFAKYVSDTTVNDIRAFYEDIHFSCENIQPAHNTPSHLDQSPPLSYWTCHGRIGNKVVNVGIQKQGDVPEHDPGTEHTSSPLMLRAHDDVKMLLYPEPQYAEKETLLVIKVRARDLFPDAHPLPPPDFLPTETPQT